MSYPRHQLARAFKYFTRTAGSLTLNSTSWADLPTIGTTWDITLQAQVGDVLEAGITGVWDNQAVVGALDAATVVSAAALNNFSTSSATGSGVESWRGDASEAYDAIGGSYFYTVVAGDLSAGTVTVRPRYRTATAANKTLYATSDNPLRWWVRNLGPQDPN